MDKNTPNLPKTNSPDSDETARGTHRYEGEENIPDASPDIEGLQTSNKTGKHSSVEKLAASRPEFGSSPGAHAVDGAFGDDPDHPVTHRNAGPGTNQFRCSSCGRFFNSQTELNAHEGECKIAKAATAAGRRSLEQEDSMPHAAKDVSK